MNTLKLLRQDARLSQHELAQATGVPRYLIQLFESGLRTPTPTEARLLAVCLGVSEHDLVGKLPLSKKEGHVDV